MTRKHECSYQSLVHSAAEQSIALTLLRSPADTRPRLRKRPGHTTVKYNIPLRACPMKIHLGVTYTVLVSSTQIHHLPNVSSSHSSTAVLQVLCQLNKVNSETRAPRRCVAAYGDATPHSVLRFWIGRRNRVLSRVVCCYWCYCIKSLVFLTRGYAAGPPAR